MKAIWRVVVLVIVPLMLFTGIYYRRQHPPLSQNDRWLREELKTLTRIEVTQEYVEKPLFVLSGDEANDLVENMRVRDGKPQVLTGLGPATHFKFYRGTALVAEMGFLHNRFDPWCLDYSKNITVNGVNLYHPYDLMELRPLTKEYLERLFAAHRQKLQER